MHKQHIEGLIGTWMGTGLTLNTYLSSLQCWAHFIKKNNQLGCRFNFWDSCIDLHTFDAGWLQEYNLKQEHGPIVTDSRVAAEWEVSLSRLWMSLDLSYESMRCDFMVVCIRFQFWISFDLGNTVTFELFDRTTRRPANRAVALAFTRHHRAHQKRRRGVSQHLRHSLRAVKSRWLVTTGHTFYHRIIIACI